MSEMSLDMIKALFAPQVEPMATLLTLSAEGLEQPFYLTDYPEGVTSRGQPFEFFPFQIAWDGADQQEVVKETQLVIGNRDGRILNAVRTVTGQPTIKLELVRLAAPDNVERAMTGAVLTDAEDVDPKITASIKPRQFDTEPACQASYTIQRTPSLF